MKHWLRWMVLALVLVLVGRWLWQRLFVTDEIRVHRAITAMEQAVEKGSILRLEGYITQDYADEYGLDKSTLLGAVRAFRQQHTALFIHITDLFITVAPDHQTASAVLIAKVLAAGSGTAESEIRADRFRLRFRKTDAGWRLYRVESPELKFE